MMNDADKIRALVIYFQHWGREEARARQVAQGIRETMRLLRVFCADEEGEESLAERLGQLVGHIGTSRYLWVECADVLLNECGGGFPFSEVRDEEGFFYDEEELLFDRKSVLEDNLNLLNEDTAYMIYDEDFDYDDVLSVDAIVALF